MKKPLFDLKKSAKANLREMVRALNKGPKPFRSPGAYRNLLSLIEAWRESMEKYEHGMSAWKATGDPEMSLPFPPKMRRPEGSPDTREIGEKCTVVVNAFPPRWQFSVFFSGEEGVKWTDWDLAWFYFLKLAMNAECGRFRGPCPRCGNFFLRETVKEKRFCSSECARASAARTCTQRRRDQERADKLAAVEEAISRRGWVARKQPWQEWVLGELPELSRKWLTRAIRNQELLPPVEGTAGLTTAQN
jgi:hypothetical protein